MIFQFHAINRFAMVVFFIASLLTLSACAETEIPLAEDATTDTSTSMDVENDTSSLPDVATDIPDTPEPDTRCGVCCPDEVRCSSTGVREVCNASGTAYVEDACPDTQQCDGGICVDKPICIPGETRCHDTETLLTCNVTGMRFSTEKCDTGHACINAQCVPGQPNGTQCTGDTDCAGEKCRCGANDNCPGPWKPTYCTNECAKASDCASDEWCLSAALSSAQHNSSHCVTRCEQSCAINGLACAHIPVHQEDGTIAWQQGCVQKELKSIGDKCAADSECISGTCLEYFSKFKFCTTRCENSGCSENSACVKLIGEEHWCSLTCDVINETTRVCPFSRADEFSGATCKSLPLYAPDGMNTHKTTCAKI